MSTTRDPQMMSAEPEFKIGDTAFLAFAGTVEKWQTCPACAGKKALTVIMGDDSRVSIDCSMCSAGYNPPRGAVEEYAFECRAKRITISEVRMSDSGHFEYNNQTDVFATEEEANACAQRLGEAEAQRQKDRLEWRKEHEQKTWSWNAAHHRRELGRAQREIEYHTKKLSVAKSKAREDQP